MPMTEAQTRYSPLCYRPRRHTHNPEIAKDEFGEYKKFTYQGFAVKPEGETALGAEFLYCESRKDAEIIVKFWNCLGKIKGEFITVNWRYELLPEPDLDFV